MRFASLPRSCLPFFLLLLLPTAHANECPSGAPEAFASFFSRFADDKAFAISRTVFPLRAKRLEFGLPPQGNNAPMPVRFRIAKPQYENQPSLSAYIKHNQLKSRVRRLGSHSAVVAIYKEDSDWLTTEHFVRRDNCWFLHEHQDHSSSSASASRKT